MSKISKGIKINCSQVRTSIQTEVGGITIFQKGGLETAENHQGK